MTWLISRCNLCFCAVQGLVPSWTCVTIPQSLYLEGHSAFFFVMESANTFLCVGLFRTVFDLLPLSLSLGLSLAVAVSPVEVCLLVMTFINSAIPQPLMPSSPLRISFVSFYILETSCCSDVNEIFCRTTAWTHLRANKEDQGNMSNFNRIKIYIESKMVWIQK